MGLEDRIVIFGGDALAGSKALREPGGPQREGILDAEFAGHDIAMESKPTGVGSALAGAGHGQSSVVTFREIATKGHYIHLGFRIAAKRGKRRLPDVSLWFLTRYSRGWDVTALAAPPARHVGRLLVR